MSRFDEGASTDRELLRMFGLLVILCLGLCLSQAVGERTGSLALSAAAGFATGLLMAWFPSDSEDDDEPLGGPSPDGRPQLRRIAKAVFWIGIVAWASVVVYEQFVSGFDYSQASMFGLIAGGWIMPLAFWMRSHILQQRSVNP
ncbi:hypothetical protein OKA06_10320 [Novosphingobium sp. MW5]|nr:hypothetical protein [Novosphingobium sp. MW5]